MSTRRDESRGRSLARAARQIGYFRLAITLAVIVVGVLVARWSWHSPLQSVEGTLYDIRVGATAARVGQDPRILMILYTDETLKRVGKRSPLDRGVLARTLRRIDGWGAEGIAIDMLLDQPQPEDAELVAAFRAMKTPTYLGYATAATNPDQMFDWQQAYLDALLAQAGPRVGKTSVRLLPDNDRPARRWPDRPAGLPPVIARSLAAGPAFAGYEGAIRFQMPRSDEPVFASVPIDMFADPPLDAPAYWDLLKQQVAGRYVLIGGDIIEQDRYDTPLTRAFGLPQTFGLEVHAAMLAQLLDGFAFAAVPGWGMWGFALLAVLAGALTGLRELRTWQLALALGAEFVLLAGLPFALQALAVDTHGLPAFGWLLGWFIGYVSAATAARGLGAEQRKFAQSALGKYLPRDVASEILRDPERLRLSGEKREIYALFSDLEGFTRLSHAIPPETVAYLLNRYLDMLSEVVLTHGGTIDKFVGDAVVAFWGAPFSKPDDADRAVKAAIAVYEAGERFRAEAPEGVPPIGCTRVGLHLGEAIVGNFGGEGRIQYTALGDAMNCASRLEGANKYLQSTVLVSKPVVERSTLDIFRPMGRIVLSGRSTPLAVFEPVPNMDADERREIAELYHCYDNELKASALDGLWRCAEKHSGDRALAAFVSRLMITGPGGSYVLESK